MKQLSLLLTCFFPLFTLAQSIGPQVIASAGTSYQNGNTQLSWTLGEMAGATWSNGSTILTEGFHQPEVMITSIGPISMDDGIRVFPVPTAANLTVQLPEHLINSNMQLMDTEGKLVREQRLSASNNNLALEGLSQGIYLLRLVHQDNNSTYRIQLIQ